MLQRILLNDTLEGGLNMGVNHLLGLDGLRDLGLNSLGSRSGCNSIVSYGTDCLLSLCGFRGLGLGGLSSHGGCKSIISYVTDNLLSLSGFGSLGLSGFRGLLKFKKVIFE